MKLLKLVDLIGQVLMLSIGITLWLIPGNTQSLFPAYYLVGSWQLLSLFLHYLLKPGWLNLKDRRIYAKTLLWTFVIGLVCTMLLTVSGAVLLFFLAMLFFVSPAYATWYFIIGLTEWKTIKNRELIHLKR
ncbi:MAG: hypothetical protein JNM88_05785 [Chitinophagaceae bacterium]|nr:hypothetical protein [Chitinophagaceae bacterium]